MTENTKTPDPADGKKKDASFFDNKFSIEAIQHEPYEDGFTWRTMIGALFVAFVMLPGVIFMGLMIGADLGGAAEWVTIIVFVEVARRSFVQLRRQELYMLKYTIGSFSHIQGGLAIGGGYFGFMVLQRYWRNSDAFENFGIAQDVPDWFAPYGNDAWSAFTNWEVWGPVITVVVVAAILSKLTMLSLGFIVYKLTSDVERLPFPLAPIHAEGAIALAETSQDKNQRGFRQYCFSIGVMCGAVFGIFYVAIPTLTNAIFGRTIQIIPIPFWDLTKEYESLLTMIRGESWGGGTLGISLNMGLIFLGFVLPWRIMLGGFIAAILFQLIVNPILQLYGYMPHWSPGKDAIETHVAATLDIYLSVGIGTSLAIFALGAWSMVKSLVEYRKKAKAGEISDDEGIDLRRLFTRDIARGDPPTWVAFAVWIGTSICFVYLSHYLVNSGVPPEEQFPLWILVAFAFVVTPANTYINARMSGIAGQFAGVPFITESAIFLSNYQKVDIWFAPLPIQNFGQMADKLRIVQLTRTRFTSVLKAELFIFPLGLITSFIFWSYITGLGPIPSENYPYVQKFWPQHAQMKALWASSKLEGGSLLMQSITPEYIALGFGVVLLLFTIFGLVGISAQYIYGGIRTINAYPHVEIPIFIGALLGRFVFAKKFGRKEWQNYAPILAVGFGAGMGLIGMFSIAINFLWVSIGTGY